MSKKPQLAFIPYIKIAQAGGQTWDLLVFVYFLSLKLCPRPLDYCPPPLHSFRVELRVMPVPGAVVVLSHILCLSLPA